MLKLGRGFDRKAVRKALQREGASTVRYKGILRAQDIREAVAGVRDAGSPREAMPILAWLASHPNTPEDVLRDLEKHGPKEVLLSLCLNRNLPPDLRKMLLAHRDSEIRQQAHHVFTRTKKH